MSQYGDDDRPSGWRWLTAPRPRKSRKYDVIAIIAAIVGAEVLQWLASLAGFGGTTSFVVFVVALAVFALIGYRISDWLTADQDDA